MVETALVGEFVPEAAVLAGCELLKQLDRTKLNVRAALWIRLNEKTTWTLELATPMAVQVPRRRPPASVFFVTTAKSGPGTSTRTRANTRNER